ncbi:phage baseplate protein [Rhodanobacter hydrolyticus]|uniref:Dit-like phage tail protein N-terminal domain-containing protein n=1 Tax=Rhodanobacter hydrolyticus TaxID=2250595 RepID=A0ABW8J6Y0_9GAMM
MPSQVSAILLAGSSIADGISLITGAWATQWAIYATGTSNPAILPDSFAAIDFNGDSRVCDYPVEQGGFESYNKVMVPEELRIRLVCGGKNMGRDDFLATLRIMRYSTNLYDIATPDDFLPNMSLTRYDYVRSAQNGVTMLTVDAVFNEIMEAASPTYSSNTGTTPVINSDSPSAASPTQVGSVSVSFPNAPYSGSGQSLVQNGVGVQ